MTTATIEEKIDQLSDEQRAALDAALNEHVVHTNDLARGTIVTWSYIPYKGGTIIGDCASHSTRPDLVRPDIQTSTVLFIDRRDGGFAITRNTFYDLVGEEVTLG